MSDIDHLFSRSTDPDSGGIYMYNGEPDGGTAGLKYHLGRGWIRSASVEYFNSDKADGSINFQANCGIKIHGGATRTRSKTEKHSFKIGFKADYGPTKLKQQLFGKDSPEQYDWLVLRGGFDSRLGLQVMDPWAKSAMRDMGQYAACSKFVHLYLNGLYWGMYNLSEQMDENCMRDNLGGSAVDYDVLKDYAEVEAGDYQAWDKMVAMAGDHIEDPENYQKLLGNNPDGTSNAAYEKLLNPESLTDYILMNMYAGMTDWDHHNWVAARRKTDSEGFHFVAWDAEKGLTTADNVSQILERSNENRPTGLFFDLIGNDQFKDLFISGVNKHFFEGGALTPDAGLKRYERWLDEIDTALIADQARWVWDASDIWNKGYHSYYRNDYFSPRTEDVFKTLIRDRLYPLVQPVLFNTSNQSIPEDYRLFMSSTPGSEIRYTTDGIDPGHFMISDNNSIKTYDYNAIPLPPAGDTLHISARVKKDSLWSVLVHREYVISTSLNTGIEKTSDTGYLQCYPNPVLDLAQLEYSLPAPGHISLKIFSMMGREIATLEDGEITAGHHVVTWVPGNIPSGLYLCVLENRSESIRYTIRIVIK